MTPQQFYDEYIEKKNFIDKLRNELENLKEIYAANYGLFDEHEILVNGKVKHMKLLKTTSQCVHNVKYDVGILVSPKEFTPPETTEEDVSDLPDW